MKLVFSLMLSSSLCAASYPITVAERPLTMPKNSFQSSIFFGNDYVSQLGFNYGITDRFQLGLSWNGMAARRIDSIGAALERKVNLNASLYFLETPYTFTMVTVSVPFRIQNKVLQEASLELPTYVPILPGKLTLVFLKNLVNLNWAYDELIATFAFPVALTWQATRELYLSLGTNTAVLSTTGVHQTIIDSTPIEFGALYGVTENIDIGGSMGMKNIQNGTGFSIMLGVLIRGGALNS